MVTLVDTENRVILNVGGIRHETYKVSIIFLLLLIILNVQDTEFEKQLLSFLFFDI